MLLNSIEHLEKSQAQMTRIYEYLKTQVQVQSVMYFYAGSFECDPTEVEDAVYQVFAEIALSPLYFLSENGLYKMKNNQPMEINAGYILAAIKNRLISVFRRSNPELIEERGLLPNFPSLSGEATLLETILTALKTMSEEMRTPYYLYYFMGYSYPEISEGLEVPLNTVRSRISRTREHVGDYLRVVLAQEVMGKGKVIELVVSIGDTLGEKSRRTYFGKVFLDYYLFQLTIPQIAQKYSITELTVNDAISRMHSPVKEALLKTVEQLTLEEVIGKLLY